MWDETLAPSGITFPDNKAVLVTNKYSSLLIIDKQLFVVTFLFLFFNKPIYYLMLLQVLLMHKQQTNWGKPHSISKKFREFIDYTLLLLVVPGTVSSLNN